MQRLRNELKTKLAGAMAEYRNMQNIEDALEKAKVAADTADASCAGILALEASL